MLTLLTLPMVRDTYHHGDLRRALLDAALARIISHGIGGLSLRGIARDVGVTHAAPYRHFADKAALIAAVAEEGFDTLAADVHDAMQTGDATARFDALGRAYVRFAVANPAYFKVMFGPGQNDEQLEVLVEAVRQAEAHGARDASHVALAAWCMVHGIATLAVDGRLAPTDLGLAVDDVDGMVDALLNARPLRASASSSPPTRRSGTD